eukprot:2772071-Rhodomonas_salina.2
MVYEHLPRKANRRSLRVTLHEQPPAGQRSRLLSEAVFDEVELSEIGLDLDRRERAAGLGGMESQNVRADGFFSVQVLLPSSPPSLHLTAGSVLTCAAVGRAGDLIGAAAERVDNDDDRVGGGEGGQEKPH